MMRLNSRPGHARNRHRAAQARVCSPPTASPGRLFLRAAPSHLPPGHPCRAWDWDHLLHCEHQVIAELAARGYVLDEYGYVQDLDGAQCYVGLLATGAMHLAYEPARSNGISAGEAARLVLALLTGVRARVLPAAEPSLTLQDAVCRLLRSTGLSARAADVRYDDGEMYPQVVVTNPAARVRGSARLCQDEAVLWDCRFAGPGRPGMAPAEVADATSAALAVASACGATVPPGWHRG